MTYANIGIITSPMVKIDFSGLENHATVSSLAPLSTQKDTSKYGTEYVAANLDLLDTSNVDNR